MIKLFQQPHPFIFNRFSVLIPVLLTFGVLFTLRPFGFNTFSGIALVGWSAVFSLIVGISILGIIFILKKYWAKAIEEHWTVGKEITLILFVLSVIMLVISLLFFVLNPTQDLLKLLQFTFVRTVAISIFPVAFLVIYEQYYYQKKQRKEAQLLTQELQQQQFKLEQEKQQLQDMFQAQTEEPEPESSSQKLVLEADNGKVILQLENEQILYVQSEGNYVEVFYKSSSQIQKQLIRNSLKKLESVLPEAQFFRCHKGYIINLSKIQKVEGNARNLELILEEVSQRIPVSRTKARELPRLLKGKTD